MANVNLSAIMGGSVQKTVSAVSIIQIASGTTGIIATIPAVSGQTISLTHLSATGTQAGISLESDSVEVLPASILEQAYRVSNPSVGSFVIGGNSGVQPVTTAVGVNLTIVKNTGNTTESIFYSYQYIQ